MEMFEGKEGYRIYKKKEDAEFMASLARERNVETKILNVRVKKGDVARKEGFTIHQDVSIAASSPSIGETGWIVLKGDEKIPERLKEAIEIIDE